MTLELQHDSHCSCPGFLSPRGLAYYLRIGRIPHKFPVSSRNRMLPRTRFPVPLGETSIYDGVPLVEHRVFRLWITRSVAYTARTILPGLGRGTFRPRHSRHSRGRLFRRVWGLSRGVGKGLVSCVRLTKSDWPNKRKFSARSYRAMHVCADALSASAARLFGRSKQQKNWRLASAAR